MLHHLFYISYMELGTYFGEEMLTILIHRWRTCQSKVDTYMKITSVKLRCIDDVRNLIGLEGHLCHEDDVAVI